MSRIRCASRRMDHSDAYPALVVLLSVGSQIHYLTHSVVGCVRAYRAWAAPIIGALGFGESLAFISLLIPAWAMLVGLGTLIGPSGISFWPIWVAGAVGAAL